MTAGQLSPLGLPGLESRFSRFVTVPDVVGLETPAAEHRWHLLDNAEPLAALGATPVGTILAVHGNPTWSYLWRSLVSAATAQAEAGGPAWRVIAVDQLEMGYSERTGRTLTLSDRIDDLGALTDALGLDGPVVTMGHDWGGVISLGWATRHPQLLAGVMALNTAVHQPTDAPIPAPLRLALKRSLLAGSTVQTPAFLNVTLSLAQPALSPEVRAAYTAPYATAERRRGIGAFVADIPVDERHRSFPELERVATGVSRLRVPALLLWGPKDPVFSDRYLADLVNRMPHADVHRFEGAGHLIAEDIDFAPVVLQWLSERVLANTPEAASAAGHDATPDVGDAQAPAPAPLWSYLDRLRDSNDTALVEMAPSTGAGPRTVSWRLLSRRVREIAAGLVAHGVRPGDRVSVLVPAGADLTAVLYACLRIGAIVVVADAGLGVNGLSRAVRGAWPDHVIGIQRALLAAKALGWPGQKFSATRLTAPAARALGVTASLSQLAAAGRAAGGELPPEPQPDDFAAILFTSGSTGPAKGVAYTHRQLGALSETLSAQFGLTVGSGLVAGFAPFALLGPALGATSVSPDMDVTSPGTLTAGAVADATRAADADVIFASPAALMNVVATADSLTDRQRVTLAGVHTLLSAGAPLSLPLLEQVSALLPSATVHTPYGMTEGLLLTDITLEGILESDSESTDAGGVCVGAAAGSATIRISPLDETGAASGPLTDAANVTGEIVVSAPHIKDHYDRLWITQRDSDRDSTPDRRWHRTGDVGHLDASGRLWVEGRLPHVIVTDTGVITPVGPEQRVERLPGLGRAAAVGVGPSGTQQVVIVAESRPPARRPHLASARLTADVRRAAGVAVAAVLIVPLLPTDIRHNSKVNRSALARWATGVLAGGRMRRP
ncbi:alpha/beta fold hydrolase [Salinibacterium sp. ZJ454]|uniref:alpha/beta fold hydrolase n=1 Tax=Salinibacterium sp. ZJ454 TaxID=2708339 RepID=UPI001FBBE1F1|nr:alpha/beta fold hydrolase [Salinibacterium sp. ZJ454]